MDPFLSRFREAYSRNPGLVLAFLAISAVLGLIVGYRFLGPAIFG